MSNANQFRVTAEYLAQQGLSLDFPIRFFSKVRITESYWFWDGATMRFGYGYIQKYGFNGAPVIRAHRASYILHFGPIPHGLCVLHDCPDGDCPNCVNPAHLRIGNQKDNAMDREAKNRGNHSKGQVHPKHKLTDEQIGYIFSVYPKINQSQLARELGVTQTAIWYIVHRKTWRHLDFVC